MEDTLRGIKKSSGRRSKSVLILVLMEDTLREHKQCQDLQLMLGLNPCFNGRYSQRCLLYYNQL